MKVQIQFDVPDEITATVTVQATIAKWKLVKNTLKVGLEQGAYHSDVQDLFRDIRDAIDAIEKTTQ